MTTDSFSFDTEIKEIKITKQISNWMRILEIGCKCQTAEGLVLWKHLPAAIRYQDTLLISPLIFCSASILWSSLSLSYVLISPRSISKLEHSYQKTSKGWAELIANCLFSYSTLAEMAHVCLIFGRGHVLVTSFAHSTFKFFTSHLSVYSMWCLFVGVIYLQVGKNCYF